MVLYRLLARPTACQEAKSRGLYLWSQTIGSVACCYHYCGHVLKFCVSLFWFINACLLLLCLYHAKWLGGKHVSEMTYFVLSGMHNINLACNLAGIASHFVVGLWHLGTDTAAGGPNGWILCANSRNVFSLHTAWLDFHWLRYLRQQRSSSWGTFDYYESD